MQIGNGNGALQGTGIVSAHVDLNSRSSEWSESFDSSIH
jgi:hypothetical protein